MVGCKGVVEAVDVILVQPLQGLCAEMLRKLVQTLDLEERKDPLVKSQFPVERYLRLVATGTRRHQAAPRRLPLTRWRQDVLSLTNDA